MCCCWKYVQCQLYEFSAFRNPFSIMISMCYSNCFYMKMLYNKVIHCVIEGMRNDRLSLLYYVRVHSNRVFFLDCKIRRD
jgi:hypothetical protein